MACRPRVRTKDPRSTTERGYGHAHQQERKRWAPRVATGRIICWRCGHPIQIAAAWDLGHDDHDRTRYLGPEHLRCNRVAGAKKGNARQRARRLIHITTRLRW